MHRFRREMLEGDLARIQESLDTIAESDSFRIVYFLDSSGRVVYAPQTRNRPTQMDNTQSGCQPCHRLPAKDRPQSVVVTAEDGERVFRTMLPIENSPACARCHDPNQKLLGGLLTDISMAPLEAAVTNNMRTNILWSVGMVVITVIIVTFGMNKLVIRRLEGAVKTLHRFAEGDREVRLQLQGSDEIATLGAAFNDMAQSVESQDEANRVLSEDLRRQSTRRRELIKKIIGAQEEERKTVARDLHDGLGQRLASIALGLNTFESLPSRKSEEAKSRIRTVRSQINDMNDQIHDLIADLRPSDLDHLGLEAALRIFGAPMLKEAGVKLDIVSQVECRLPAEIETTVFRTFQESLTNIVRHAQAKHATIHLAVKDGMFEGEVSDDGQGFEIEQVYAVSSRDKGYGLLGMDERVALCGGELKIFSKPGTGTRVQVRIPISDVVHD